MTNENLWYVMFVDDEPETCEQVASYLNGQIVMEPDGKLKVDTEVDFNKALGKLESSRYDLVILDIRLGPLDEQREEEAGITTLELIKSRRFVPVIFYTALPQKVRHLETPLIRVVEKTEGVPKILLTVKEVFSTRLPFVNRALLRHLEEIQRLYMWEFVSANWEKFGDTPDRTALAYLLARRLAKSLDGPEIHKLAERLGDSTRVWCSVDNVHPMMCYIIPPSTEMFSTGDILQKSGTEGADSYWLILTPSCDFIESGQRTRKAEHVLIVLCQPLVESPEYQQWKGEETPSSGKNKKLKALIRTPHETPKGRQEGRYYFLPGALGIPDLVVDFQQAHVEPFENISQYVKIATLDNPFCESLVYFFTRYVGRVGTPDLDIDKVFENL